MSKRVLFPVPKCPECKTDMILREPKQGDDWEAFWGCPRFPKCRGTRNIDLVTGKPETDYERDERRLDNLDYDYKSDGWGDDD